MKLEKHGGDMSHSSQSATPPRHQKGRSHILVYILILFIAAFFLMTLSFLSHQRSNEQVMGQLNTNVSSLQKLQTALEENVILVEQVSEQELEIEALEDALETAKTTESQLKETISALEKTSTQQKTELETLQNTVSAMTALSELQQLLISGDMDACRTRIAAMEAAGLEAFLPDTAATGDTSPLQVFRQIKALTAIPAEG